MAWVNSSGKYWILPWVRQGKWRMNYDVVRCAYHVDGTPSRHGCLHGMSLADWQSTEAPRTSACASRHQLLSTLMHSVLTCCISCNKWWLSDSPSLSSRICYLLTPYSPSMVTSSVQVQPRSARGLSHSRKAPLGRMSNKEAEHTCTKPKLGFFQRSWWMELLSALGMETMSSIGWEAQSQKSPWPGAGQAARMGGGPGHVALTTPTRCSEMSLGSLSDRWGPGQAFGFYAAVSLFPL